MSQAGSLTLRGALRLAPKLSKAERSRSSACFFDRTRIRSFQPI